MTLAELRARGVNLRADEAVAIAQQLMSDAAESTEAHPPFGPLTEDTVAIAAGGRVHCFASAATPSVAETAILLHHLLDDHGSTIPGGLRYVLGRALLEVEAPPFDSLEDFSTALQRFEQGDRTAVIAALYARARGAAGDQQGSATAFETQPLYRGIERRQHMPSSAELRRQLRDIDKRLYEASRPAAVSGGGRPPRNGRAPFTAASIVACSAIVAAGGLGYTSGVAYTRHARTRAAEVASRPADTPPARIDAVPLDTAAVPLPAAAAGPSDDVAPRLTGGPVQRTRTMTPRARVVTARDHRLVRVARRASQPDRRDADRRDADRQRARPSPPTQHDDSGLLPHFRFEWDNPFKRTH